MVLQGSYEWLFFALKIRVAESVETRRMIHFGEMSKLVTDYVFAKLQREENKGATESYDAGAGACAECAQTAANAP